MRHYARGDAGRRARGWLALAAVLSITPGCLLIDGLTGAGSSAGETADAAAVTPQDAGLPGEDAGLPLGLDAGAPADAEARDAGMPPPEDAGLSEDAAAPPDAGMPPPEDAGLSEDAASPPDASEDDGGVSPPDAGAPPPGDAGMPPPGYVLVPAGTFTMGSPANEVGRGSDEVQHQVTITRDFWLKETEVTQGEWRALMGSDPSNFSACGDACPVETVSWFDAVDYVNAVSRSVGLPECYGGSGTERTFVGLSCRGYRLPTEAEWEYAARAGTTGATYGALDAIAWHSGNSGSRTQPVRGKQANAWGLHDMIGNVWEWTHDWYRDYEGAATDPVGPVTGSSTMFRGGGLDCGAAGCRAASRGANHFGYASLSIGFRPARSAFP